MNRKIIPIDQLQAIKGKVADFKGTWDVRLPKDGYYELFITGKPTEDELKEDPLLNVSGIITDMIGNATFVGTLKEKEFFFLKTYDTVAIDKGAAVHGVDYLFSGDVQSGKEIFGVFSGFKARSFSGSIRATIQKVI